MSTWQVPWQVFVDDMDMSDRMNPYLVSIEMQDKEGKASDTASLTFDDCDGQCFLPKGGERVRIIVRGVEIFDGFVSEPDWSFARGGGRELTVECSSNDPAGKTKDGQGFHKDDATLGDFLDAFAKRAGLEGVTVDPAFKSIKRDYWSSDGKSFIQFGQDIAESLGGIFKVRGKKAVLAKKGSGTSATGQAMTTVILDCGDPASGREGNVINLRIKPFNGRANRSKAVTSHFDRKKAKWEREELTIEQRQGAGESIDRHRFASADPSGAKERNAAGKTGSQHQRGGGSASIDLEVQARAGGMATIRGARPGIDGTLKIESVRHRLSRSGGATTDLDLKHPDDKVGKDSRKAKPKT